jgi:hypothetical protein
VYGVPVGHARIMPQRSDKRPPNSAFLRWCTRAAPARIGARLSSGPAPQGGSFF